jgi:hypothetical protein
VRQASIVVMPRHDNPPQHGETNMSDSAPTDEPDPRDTRHAIRAALVHAWTLAAAYEGRGPRVPAESIDDDQRCLFEVVNLLLAHRDQQLAMMRLKTAVGFVEWIVPIYRDYLADQTLDVDALRGRLEARARELQLEVPPAWLSRLAAPRHEFKKTRFHSQGVVETARFLVGKLFEVSGSQLSHEKDARRRDMSTLNTAFGRVPSKGMAAAYARQVLEWVPAADSPERETWLLGKMFDDQTRASFVAMPAIFEAAVNRADVAAAAPTLHPVLRADVDRALNKGLDDGRWPAEHLCREDFDAFLANELAVFDGRAAPPLVDRDPPAAETQASKKSSRRATKPPDGKPATGARTGAATRKRPKK